MTYRCNNCARLFREDAFAYMAALRLKEVFLGGLAGGCPVALQADGHPSEG